MKTIIVHRHAKSSWKHPGLRDHDRPLNRRGKINLRFMAERFAQSESVDVLISSTAQRASSTASGFKSYLPAAPLLHDERIYGADVSRMMQLINGLDDGYDSVMLFGHNPTFSSLAHHLCYAFNEHLVTCARVRIDFKIESWQEIIKDLGTLVYHDYPRRYPEMENL